MTVQKIVWYCPECGHPQSNDFNTTPDLQCKSVKCKKRCEWVDVLFPEELEYANFIKLGGNPNDWEGEVPYMGYGSSDTPSYDCASYL